MNRKIIFLLCSILILGCTRGTLENGAEIIPSEEGNASIKIPPPPKGYDMLMVESNINLYVMYKNITVKSNIMIIRYFAGKPNDPAKNYILIFDY